jgi:hypothetical protein
MRTYQGRHAARKIGHQRSPQPAGPAHARPRRGQPPEISRGERALTWILLLYAVAEVLTSTGTVLAPIALITTLISNGPGR